MTPKEHTRVALRFLARGADEGEVTRYMVRRRTAERTTVHGGVMTDALVESRLEKMRDWNWYVQLNPTLRLKHWRAESRDVTRSRFLLVDIDRATPFDRGLGRTVGAIFLQAFRREVLGGYSSALIMHSGRGLQLWIELPEVAVTPEALPLIDRVRAGLIKEACRVWGQVYHGASPESGFVDTSSADLPRVARLPGTINQKTGLMAEVLHEENPEILEPWIGTFDDLVRWAVPEPEPVPSFSETGNIGARFHLLSKRAKGFIIKGEPAGSRHEAAHATAMSCLEAGLTEDAMRAAVYRGADKCSLERTEADASIRSALKKWRRR